MMQKISKSGLIVFLCLLSLIVFSQNAANSTAQKEILCLEDMGRQKALKGDSVWDDLIAENAYMIAYDGTILVYKKGQSLPSLSLRSFVLSEMIVRVYGKEAVVTGLARVGAETPAKKPYSFQMRFLNVWQKFRGGWKIVVSERTGVKQ